MPSVVDTRLTFRGQSGNLDWTGTAEYVEIYLVLMDSPNGTGIEAIDGNPDIPAFGTQFAPTVFPNLVVTGYRPSKLENDPVRIEVMVQYSTPRNNPDDGVFPPTDRPVRRAGAASLEEFDSLLDANGNPIIMSNGRPPSRPIKLNRPVFKSQYIKWHDNTFTIASLMSFFGRVNSSTFDGAPAGTMKFTGATFRQEWLPNGSGLTLPYYEVTYDFSIDPIGWNDQEYASNDIYELREFPAGSTVFQIFRIKDEAGRDISSPQFLDANGKGISPTALLTGTLPHTFTVDGCLTANMNSLGLV